MQTDSSGATEHDATHPYIRSARLCFYSMLLALVCVRSADDNVITGTLKLPECHLSRHRLKYAAVSRKKKHTPV